MLALLRQDERAAPLQNGASHLDLSLNAAGGIVIEGISRLLHLSEREEEAAPVGGRNQCMMRMQPV